MSTLDRLLEESLRSAAPRPGYSAELLMGLRRASTIPMLLEAEGLEAGAARWLLQQLRGGPGWALAGSVAGAAASTVVWSLVLRERRKGVA
jgi:hypothetical protein